MALDLGVDQRAALEAKFDARGSLSLADSARSPLAGEILSKA